MITWKGDVGSRVRTALGAVVGILLLVGGGGVSVAQTPITTIQNGADAQRFELNSNGSLYVPGQLLQTVPSDSIPAEGPGTRLLWYPEKSAFRAGTVEAGDVLGERWDNSNVGRGSVAFGTSTLASGIEAMAGGNRTEATAGQAIALGDKTMATESHATALGEQTVASGLNATAMGVTTTAQGSHALAIGNSTTAYGESSVALGEDSFASDLAVAMGLETDASGRGAVAMGRQTETSANVAVATGRETHASGYATTAMGRNTVASGSTAVAMGRGTEAEGTSAVAMGEGTVALSENSVTIGQYNAANALPGELILVAGNGTGENNRSDALSLSESGNVTISGSLTENSDRRLKTNVTPLDGDILEGLAKVQPVQYQFQEGTGHPTDPQIGLIAQDVRKQFPSLVQKGSEGYLGVTYSKFSAVLLKGLQEQQAQIDRKQARIDSLEERVQRLEGLQERVVRLEQRMGSDSALAGVAGSGLLLVVLVVGLIGGGLLWRR